MAKKQKTNLDDFDFDDDIFGDDGLDFGDGGSKPKKNQPIRTITTSFAAGARDALVTPSSIKTLARSALPTGYGSAIDLGDDIFDTSRQLYNTAADELRPVVPILRKAAGKVASSTEGFVPERLRKVLSDFSERGDSQYRTPSQEEQDQNQITEELGAIFQANAEDQAKASQQERAERYLRDKVTDKQSSAMIHQLATLNTQTGRIVAYQDRITYKYQQKTLENSYRQTFMLRDSLQVQKESLAILKEGMTALVQNTSLPDYAKKSLKQSMGETFRDKLVDGAQSAAGKYVSGFLGNLTKNLTGNLKNQLGDIVSGVQGASDMASMVGDMDEMGMEGGALGMMSNTVGGMVLEAMLPSLALPFKKMFDKSSRAKQGGAMTGNFFSQIPQKMNRWAKSDSDITTFRGQLSQLLKDTIGTHSQETRINQASILKGDQPVPFDSATRLSIVEIIPGYLSRIHQEIAMLRTGDKNRDRLHFDKEKNEFVGFSSAVKSAKSRMFREDTNFQTQKSVNEVLDLIDDGSLTPDQRKALAKQLLQDSTDLRVMDKDFFSEKNAGDRYDPKTRALLQKSLQGSLQGENGETDYVKLEKLQKQFGDLANQWRDPRRAAQVYAASGDRELLRALGITTQKEGTGGLEEHMDYGKVFDDILSGKGVESTKKKKEDEPTWLKNQTKELMGRWDKISENVAETVMSNSLVQSMTERIGDAIEDGFKKVSELLKDDEDDDPFLEGFTPVDDNGPPNATRAAEAVATTESAEGKKPRFKPGRKSRAGFSLGKGALSKKDLRTAAESFGKGKEFDEAQAELTKRTNAAKKKASGLKNRASSALKGVKSAFDAKGVSGIIDHLKSESDSTDRTEGADDPDTPERGFADGGFTGYGPKFEKAGHTHRREVVFSEEDVERSGGVSAVEEIRKKGVDVAKPRRKRTPKAKSKPKLRASAKEQIFGRSRVLGSGMPNTTMGKLKGFFSFAKDEAHDLYVKGDREVRLMARKLQDGEYRDQQTGKILKSLKDITGPVIDRTGKVVLSARELASEVYDEEGRPLDGAIAAGRRFLDQAKSKYASAVAGNARLQKLDGSIKSATKSVTDKGRRLYDIYTEGGVEPALEAMRLEMGEYRDQLTGKVLTSLEDITGPVVDAEGKVVLSAEQVFKGLKNVSGQRLRTLESRLRRGITVLRQSASVAAGHVTATANAAFSTTAASPGTLGEGQLKSLEEIGSNQLVMLDSIHQRLQAIEAISMVGAAGDPSKVEKKVGRWDGPKALMKSIGSGAWGVTKGVGSYLKGAFTLQGKALSFGVGSAWGLGSSIASGIGGMVTGRHRASDVFVKGGDPKVPVLLYKTMKEGRYFDVKTDKPIKNIDGISGPVREVSKDNPAGNIVLTQEEFDKGLYDTHGKTLFSGIKRGIGAIGGAFAGYTGSVFALPFKLARTALNFATKAVDMVNEGEDVYLKGKKDCVMLNRDLKAGKYISAKTGKPIFSVKDVDGEIFTFDEGSKEKRIVITEQEAHTTPLVNWRGRPLRTLGQKGLGLVGGLTGLAARSALGLAKGYAKVVGSVLGAGRDLVVGTAKGIGRFFNPKLGAAQIDPEGVQVQLLGDIFGLLQDRLPKPKKLRKGSWQEQFDKRNEDKKAAEEKKAKEKSEGGGLWGGLKNLFSKGKAGLLGLLGLGGDDEEGEDEEDDGLGLDDAANAAMMGDAVGGARHRRREKREAAKRAKARKKSAKSRLKRMRKSGNAPKAGKYGRATRLFRGARNSRMGRLAGGTARLASRIPGVGLARRGVSRGAAKVAGNAKYAKYGGRALGGAAAVAGLAFAGKEIYDISQDKTMTQGQKQQGYAGAVGGGLGGAVGGMAVGAAVGSVVPVVGTIIGGVVGGVIGGVGGSYLGKKMSAGWNNFKAANIAMFERDPLFKLRMAQYGISMSDKITISKVLRLEYGTKNKMFETIDDLYNALEVGSGWWKSKADEVKQKRLVEWINQRFTPVFRAWQSATAVNQLKSDDDFEKVKDLPKDAKKALINAVYNDASAAYSIMLDPFSEDPSKIGPKEVEAVKNEVLADMDKGVLEKTADGLKSAARTALKYSSPFGFVASKILDRMDENKQKSASDAKAQKEAEKKGGVLAATAIAPDLSSRSGTQITAMTAIRLKTYGLTDFTPDRTNSLLSLERDVLSGVTMSGAVEASFNRPTYDMYRDHCASFGLSLDNSEHRGWWVDWFEKRFLPTVLTYVSACKRANPSIDPKMAEQQLSPEHLLNVAKSTIGAKRKIMLVLSAEVWSYVTSPWDGKEDLNSDPKSTGINLLYFKQMVDKKKLDEQKGTEKPAAPPKPPKSSDAKPASPSAAQVKPPQTASGSQAPRNSSSEKVNDAYDELAAEDARYWKSKGIDPSAVNMRDNRIESIGSRVNELPPAGGTMASLPEPAGTGKAILPMIHEAAKVVGVDPNLLATMANVESGLGKNLKASTSSASGLFQFISSTWREYMGKYAAKFGIPPGTSPFDHRANALLGAQFVKDNLDRFKKNINRAPTDVDAYLMHFLGPGTLIKMAGASPTVAAASIAGAAAAAANRSIFFKSGNVPRTVKELFEYVASLLSKKRVTVSEAPKKPDFSDVVGKSGPTVQTGPVPKDQPGMLSRAAGWVGNRFNQTVAGGKQLAQDVMSAPVAAGAWVGQRASDTVAGGKQLASDVGSGLATAAKYATVPGLLYQGAKAFTPSFAKDAMPDSPLRMVAGIGNTIAAKAASIAKQQALPESKGRCAEYVRKALDKAGFPSVRGHAYMYLYNGNMDALGYKKINVQPGQAQCGDIMLVDRNAKHKWGHIQIFDGRNWISDFIQDTPWPYREMPPWSIYRYAGDAKPSQDTVPEAAPETRTTAAATPTDISQPGGLSMMAPDASQARDTQMQQLNQRDEYSQQMGERRGQLAVDETAKLLTEQRNIQQQQLDTQIEIKDKIVELIDTVKSIQIPGPASAEPESKGKTDNRATGARRSPIPYEDRPLRSPLSVVRSRFRD